MVYVLFLWWLLIPAPETHIVFLEHHVGCTDVYQNLIKYLEFLFFTCQRRKAAGTRTFESCINFNPQCLQLYFTHLLFYTLWSKSENSCSRGSKLIFNTCTCLQKNVPSASTPGRISCRFRPDQLMSRWRRSTNAAMPSVDTDGETEPFALWTF